MPATPRRAAKAKATEPIEEQPGSGQSRASFARDLAAQPRLLAAAKIQKSRGGAQAAKKGKAKLYSFAQAATSSTAVSKSSVRRAAR